MGGGAERRGVLAGETLAQYRSFIEAQKALNSRGDHAGPSQRNAPIQVSTLDEILFFMYNNYLNLGTPVESVQEYARLGFPERHTLMEILLANPTLLRQFYTHSAAWDRADCMKQFETLVDESLGCEHAEGFGGAIPAAGGGGRLAGSHGYFHLPGEADEASGRGKRGRSEVRRFQGENMPVRMKT